MILKANPILVRRSLCALPRSSPLTAELAAVARAGRAAQADRALSALPPGIHCLIIRRTLSELRQNHVLPLLRELRGEVEYASGDRIFKFSNGSRILLGYLSATRIRLRYQGQEFDIIAIDEATQITEYQFSTLKGCLRGVGDFPRRMYLTCNPGGVGHAWVKRLFIDRAFRDGENLTTTALFRRLYTTTIF